MSGRRNQTARANIGRDLSSLPFVRPRRDAKKRLNDRYSRLAANRREPAKAASYLAVMLSNVGQGRRSAGTS